MNYKFINDLQLLFETIDIGIFLTSGVDIWMIDLETNEGKRGNPILRYAFPFHLLSTIIYHSFFSSHAKAVDQI